MALRVEVDPRQVDVNVHPTKQLVRFSDEREARLAMSGAVSNAIQGTGEPAAEQDGRSTGSGTSGTSSRQISEGAATTVPSAVPEHPPVEEHPLTETDSSIPLNKELATSNGGALPLPITFSKPPRAPVQTHQRHPSPRSSASV